MDTLQLLPKGHYWFYVTLNLWAELEKFEDGLLVQTVRTMDAIGVYVWGGRGKIAHMKYIGFHSVVRPDVAASRADRTERNCQPEE